MLLPDETPPTSFRRILLAARKRFATFGYRRTSIADIAREAGVAVGTVYKHVKGKEELFLAVVRDLNAAWLAECRRALDAPGTARERFQRLGQASVRFSADNPLLTSILRRDTEIIFAPLLDEMFEELMQQNVALMTEVVREGIREGTFRALEPERTAFILLMSGHVLSQQTRYPWGEMLPLYEDIIYAGLHPR